MPSLETLGAFALTSLVFCLIPGPNVLYIVTRTLAEGRRAGVASVAGVWIASLVHVGMAAVGLSALLASSAVAYDVVRFSGAAYLVLVGIRALRDGVTVDEPTPESQPPVTRPADAWPALRQGFVVNLLSPKTALFFLALLPQFVDPAAGSTALQVVILGAVLNGIGLLNDGLYAFAASALSERLRRRPSLMKRGQRLSGVVYIGLGVGAAVMGGRKAG